MTRLLILFLTVTGTPPGAADAQAGPVAADTIPRVLDRVFDRWRGTDGPGCAVSVRWRGHPVYTRVYGMANLETGTPIRPSSRFMVASVSKQFTAMAILLLERDGRLSIDDDIRKYLPEIPNYGMPVTIRHLLAHTSGLRDPLDLLYLARGTYLTPEWEGAVRVTEAEFLDILSRQKALGWAPGTEYRYNNGGYMLLGLIVSRVAGTPLRVFADERIFKPLGMASTSVGDDSSVLVPERATGYSSTPGGWQLASITSDVPAGASGVFTTVGDLLRWEANFDRPVVGERAMFEAMQTRGVLTNGDSTNYGLGTQISRYRGARLIFHTGGADGYQAFLGRFPDHGLALATACNAAGAGATSLTLRVADAIIGDSLAPIAVAAAPAATQDAITLPAATLQSRVGAYLQPATQPATRNPAQLVQLRIRDGRLVFNDSLNPLAAMSTDRFVDQFIEIVFGPGDHPGFELRRLNGVGRPVPYIWMPPPVVSPAALAAYAGSYCSEELDTCVRVSSQDTVLSFYHAAHSTPATPVFADGFTWFGYDVRFHRAGGRIIGFEVSENDFRHIQFVRTPVGR